MSSNNGPPGGKSPLKVVGAVLLGLLAAGACILLSGVIAFWIICGVR